jgi:hypothetical protein
LYGYLMLDLDELSMKQSGIKALTEVKKEESL